MKKIAVLYSRVRVEEKQIFEALERRGVPFEKIDVRELVFDVGRERALDCDVALVRCVSQSQATYVTRLLEMQGVRTVNSHAVITTCGDKALTTLSLWEHGVPTPRTWLAFSQEMALGAVEELGYPAVLKPPVGSWGRLLAKVNDRQAAEAIVEHKEALDRGQQTPFYIQEYVRKAGAAEMHRDIRAMVIGDETVYAVYRNSPHWITNTARDGQASPMALTPEVDRLCRAAAQAVGGGIVAVDLLEAPDGTLLVNEVNHTPEFHGAMKAVEVDIAGGIVDYVLRVARET